ncbi:MAG: M14 family zinc carboxypeptidase [candidate division KSB1 bacterium]|nr:M14 family zinc carboxypeptidase [candidate division KSB1 bacterium]
MHKNAMILAFLGVMAAVAAAGTSVRQLVRVRLVDQEAQVISSFAALAPDIAGSARDGTYVDVIATPEQRAAFARLGLKTETLIDDLEALDKEWRTQGYFDRFHNYQQVVEAIHQAAMRYPGLAQVVDIGDSWEKTQNKADRDIWAVKISDNAAVEEDEPEVLIMGCHHAREIITPEIVLYFMNYLLTNYGTDPYVTYLVDNRQIWLVPLVNPDGHAYVFTTDRWWRKNRRDNGDGSYGVDLNRNYGYMWGYDNQGSSPIPSDQTYRGPAAFSEPEVQAIRDLCLQHRFKISLSYHSYGQLLLYPWGYRAMNTPDHAVFKALADSCVAYNGYSPGNAASGTIYITNGDSDDWLYGEQTQKNKIFAFTPEVGVQFHPDTSRIMQEILENLGPNLYICYAAGEEPIITHTPLRDTEDTTGPYRVEAKVSPAIPLSTTAPSPIVREAVWLHFAIDGQASFDSVAMLPQGEQGVFAAQLPGQESGATVVYYISARDEKGQVGRAPRAAPTALYRFTVAPDTVPPTLAHLPITEKSVFDRAYPVVVQARDNSGIARILVQFRKNGGPLDSLRLVPTGLPEQYRAEILAQNPAAGDHWEYRIVAEDASRRRNRGFLPEFGFFTFVVTADLLFDFESEAAFTCSNSSDWQWGIPTSGPRAAHSGHNVWATNLAGNYRDYSDSRLDTPPIELPSHASSVQLRFWHWYEFEYSGALWDGGNIKISVDGGPFALVYPVGGYDNQVHSYNAVLGGEPAFGGPSGTGDFWHEEIVDLSAYAGHRVQIRFHFASDSDINLAGWYIDDVRLDFGTAVVTADECSSGQAKFTLSQAYPNPFNPATTLVLEVPFRDRLSIRVVDVLGKTVRNLGEAYFEPGMHRVRWDGNAEGGTPVPSGLYVIVVRGRELGFTRKVVKLE